MSSHILSLSILFGIVTTTALAADNDADGFVPLFNGRDLAGWVGVNVAPSTFTVKDGLIFCTGVPTGVLRTEKMYENFIAECEWRHLVPKGNAGFFVWSDALTSKGQPFTLSIEVQVLDGPNHPERRYTTHGDVFPIHGATMIPDNPYKTAKPGASGRSYPTEDRSNPSPQWNHYRVECRDGNITLAVNGKVVTSGKNASPRKGYICLESEGGQVEWRNLKIKELPSNKQLDEKDIAQTDQGHKSLYTGLDLDGWTPPRGAAESWRANDWKLHYEPGKTGEDATLWNKTELTDYELIVDIHSAAPVDLLVSGRAIRIEPLKPGKSDWRRVHVVAAPGKIAAKVDDQDMPIGPAPALIQHSDQLVVGLRPTGAADFANLYLKDHSRAAPGK
jgi:hypothetical protein